MLYGEPASTAVLKVKEPLAETARSSAPLFCSTRPGAGEPGDRAADRDLARLLLLTAVAESVQAAATVGTRSEPQHAYRDAPSTQTAPHPCHHFVVPSRLLAPTVDTDEAGKLFPSKSAGVLAIQNDTHNATTYSGCRELAMRHLSLLVLACIGLRQRSRANAGAGAPAARAAAARALHELRRVRRREVSPDGEFFAMLTGKYGRSAMMFVDIKNKKVVSGMRAPERLRNRRIPLDLADAS